MTITFAVVKITSMYIDVNRGQDKIKDDIEEIVDDDEYVEFHTMENQDQLLECIAKHINPPGNTVTGTKTYLNGKLFQSVFDALSNTIDQSNTKLNKLGTQFADGIPTEREVILIKNNIISDTVVELTSINKLEVRNLLEDKFIKQGIVYKADTSHEIYTYSQNHLDNLMHKFGQDYVLNNFHYDEMEIGDMIFTISSNKNDTDENTLMSKIVGKNVTGNTFCSLYMKGDHTREAVYISLNKDIFDKIVYLLQCSDFDPTDDNEFENLTNENAERVMDNHNSQIVISPFTVIDRMYNKYKKSHA